MKEIDFLPQWYKDARRRRLLMRRQYATLALIFAAMMAYNLTAAHRISRATADLERFEDDRITAESVLHQFNAVTHELSQVQTQANLIEKIDSKIDVAAVLAEMSHIVGETTVLRQVEFVAEPFAEEASPNNATVGVRLAQGAGTPRQKTLLRDIRFRIVMTGLAVSPEDVAALVRRLDGSPYFRDVGTSWRNVKVQIPTATKQKPAASQANKTATEQGQTLDVSEFEIVCYLANYEEIGKR